MPPAPSFSADRPRILLGLIGAGIQASRTPRIHQREAAVHGLHCEYRLIDLDTLGVNADALPRLLEDAEREGFTGLNITHPCKQSILPLLNEISTDAAAIGAVNTVLLRDGKRIGHNTDWTGFREGFLSAMPNAPLSHVVQLGAGGAGAATAYALLRMGVGHLTVFDPDNTRCTSLVDHYRAAFDPNRISSTTRIDSSLAHADGLVHATPTGMRSHPGSPLPASLLHPGLWVAEIVYFPLETELLRAARAAGCRTVDGGGMAVHQAVEAFRLFTGFEADPERMREHFIAHSPA